MSFLSFQLLLMGVFIALASVCAMVEARRLGGGICVLGLLAMCCLNLVNAVPQLAFIAQKYLALSSHGGSLQEPFPDASLGVAFLAGMSGLTAAFVLIFEDSKK